jgi:hypothetical protein
MFDGAIAGAAQTGLGLRYASHRKWQQICLFRDDLYSLISARVCDDEDFDRPTIYT